MAALLGHAVLRVRVGFDLVPLVAPGYGTHMITADHPAVSVVTCHFCGKTPLNGPRRIIAGSRACICEKCVEQAAQILHAHQQGGTCETHRGQVIRKN